MTTEETDAFNNMAERVMSIEKDVNKFILTQTANMAALIEILGLTTDQTLDYVNLSKKNFKELSKEMKDKGFLK